MFKASFLACLFLLLDNRNLLLILIPDNKIFKNGNGLFAAFVRGKKSPKELIFFVRARFLLLSV